MLVKKILLAKMKLIIRKMLRKLLLTRGKLLRREMLRKQVQSICVFSVCFVLLLQVEHGVGAF